MDIDECQNFVPVPIPSLHHPQCHVPHSVSCPKPPPPPLRRHRPSTVATLAPSPPAAQSCCRVRPARCRLILSPLKMPPPAHPAPATLTRCCPRLAPPAARPGGSTSPASASIGQPQGASVSRPALASTDRPRRPPSPAPTRHEGDLFVFFNFVSNLTKFG
jgi:hypothetical protein